MSDAAPSTNLPATFGKYLLTDLIAVGGMAEVYKSKIFGSSGFEKQMVVKRILPRYARNPNFIQMLIDEAKIAVNLTHGNIVPIYELGEFEGSYYIAMEFIEGQTILDVLRTAHSKQRKLPWAFTLGICADVAAGLAYAHSRTREDGSPLGLVHRDINPRNIVITKDGEVKILDFGIARASTKKHQTASGVIKGTPGYMSPEQMYGHSIDHRSDLYCLGVLTHELLTLHRLFPAWTVAEMRKLFEEKTVAPPSQLAAEIPDAVDATIMKALAPTVGDRFADAGEFEEALRQVMATSGMAVTARGLAREVANLEHDVRTPAEQPLVRAVTVQSSEKHEPSNSIVSDEAEAPDGKAVEEPADPQTQPMEYVPDTVPSDVDHAFVLSLASQPGATGPADPNRPPKPLVQLEPLPETRTTTGAWRSAPRTQVLAQNADLSWAGEIGEDAELLAIARATGVAPGQTRNRLLLVAGIASLVLIPIAFWFLPDMTATVNRAIEGRKLRAGALIVKTNPSGAVVILDGTERGKTNLSIKGIDPDRNHQLVVVPEGKDPIQLEFTPTDFRPVKGLPTFIFERDFREPAQTTSDSTPPDSTQKNVVQPAPKTKRKNKRRKKTRRGKRRRRR